MGGRWVNSSLSTDLNPSRAIQRGGGLGAQKEEEQFSYETPANFFYGPFHGRLPRAESFIKSN